MEESDERDILRSASMWFLVVFIFIIVRSYFRLKMLLFE
jgi:hypothetical protein